MENNYKSMNSDNMEYILFYTEDVNGAINFGKWVKKSQYIRKKKLKKLKKLMKNEIQNGLEIRP